MAYGLKASSCHPLNSSITIHDKAKSWITCLAKHQGHLTNYQFLMKRNNKRSWGQTIDKTMAKPVSIVSNPEKPVICNKALSNRSCQNFRALNRVKLAFLPEASDFKVAHFFYQVIIRPISQIWGMLSWKLSVLVPFDKELTANCFVETHTKPEKLIPAATVKYSLNRVQLPLWL